VEIPVALLILAILLIIAIMTFKTAGTVEKGSHLGNQATAYGLAKLSQFEAYPSGNLTAGKDTVVNAVGVPFTRAWSVSDNASGKEVNVIVSWRMGAHMDSLALATLLR
jgi:hypothetical protein